MFEASVLFRSCNEWRNASDCFRAPRMIQLSSQIARSGFQIVFLSQTHGSHRETSELVRTQPQVFGTHPAAKESNPDALFMKGSQTCRVNGLRHSFCVANTKSGRRCPSFGPRVLQIWLSLRCQKRSPKCQTTTKNSLMFVASSM